MEELVLSYQSLLLSEPGALQRVGFISFRPRPHQVVGNSSGAASTE